MDKQYGESLYQTFSKSQNFERVKGMGKNYRRRKKLEIEIVRRWNEIPAELVGVEEHQPQ